MSTFQGLPVVLTQRSSALVITGCICHPGLPALSMSQDAFHANALDVALGDGSAVAAKGTTIGAAEPAPAN